MNTTFASPSDMIQWQYREILGELGEIQRHASDPNCPCVLADKGEYCLQKHALGVHTLAKETMSMVPGTPPIDFEVLAEEALDLHRALNERIVCHQPQDDEPNAVEWARQWRKKLEPVYYHSCQVSLKQDSPAEQAFTICRGEGGLVRGSQATGDASSVSLALGCPEGATPVGVAHTHPGGNLAPSAADVRESRRAGLGVLCVMLPVTGETACYDVGQGLVRLKEGDGKFERCVRAMKGKLPVGCIEAEWSRPVEERKEDCYNPYAICRNRATGGTVNMKRETEKLVRLQGETQVEILVENREKNLAHRMPAIVDTGAIYTTLPDSVVKGKLHLAPKRHQDMQYSDGSIDTRPIYEATVTVGGRTRYEEISSRPADFATIGTLTLEALGFKVNPLTRQLEDAAVRI